MAMNLGNDIPGLSWENDPGAVAGECQQYIEQRTEASIWGGNLFLPTPK